MRKTGLILILIMVFSVFTFSYDMELKVYGIVNDHWQAVDALEQGEREIYMQKMNDIEESKDKLVQAITSSKENKERFVEVFNNLPDESKHLFADIAQELNSQTRSEDLFPGYGYAEPGYYYRRGVEVRKELLQKFWKVEERTFESNYKYRFYIELKLSTQMQQTAEAGGNIEGFDVKGVYGIEVNGEIKECAEVEFSTKETLRTKCIIAYEKNKTWYELYRAEKGMWDWLPWTDLTWEECGETYLIHEEATDTEVMIEAENL